MRERRGPDCLSESVVVGAATDRLLTGPGRAWRQVTSTHAREAMVLGGGRAWTLRCSVRFEGVEGGRFLVSVSLWTGDPEAPQSRKRSSPSPVLVEFVARTQRRLRGMGFAGRFQPELGCHWPGMFSRWLRDLANLQHTLASLDRLERSMGAVAKRTRPARREPSSLATGQRV